MIDQKSACAYYMLIIEGVPKGNGSVSIILLLTYKLTRCKLANLSLFPNRR